SAGPGSYTGLRIGVSVAKGLCYSLDKPLISVPTLLSLAERVKKEVKSVDAFYMPVMDARRMDVYTAIYNSEGEEVFKTTCATVNEEFEKEISATGEIFIGGNAMNKCKEIFTSGNIHFVEGVNCDSRWMATISYSKYKRGEFENTAYYEPFYLKEFLPKTAKL
ncbi:MAG: tRNA (adenosine(37)-N6)-threonylcarbamoyltransferase complex dimerization subunit type 1 TsaB, partial [Bacteroidota bacterium]